VLVNAMGRFGGDFVAERLVTAEGASIFGHIAVGQERGATGKPVGAPQPAARGAAAAPAGGGSEGGRQSADGQPANAQPQPAGARR
jgi:hypothetical protein